MLNIPCNHWQLFLLSLVKVLELISCDRMWLLIFVLKGSIQHSLNVLYIIYPFLKAFMCNFTFFDRIPEEAYLEFLTP